MKNAILALALVGCAFGCKTDKQAAVSDASATPVAEKSADCCAEKAAACTDKAASSAECAKKCPVTGKTIE